MKLFSTKVVQKMTVRIVPDVEQVVKMFPRDGINSVLHEEGMYPFVCTNSLGVTVAVLLKADEYIDALTIMLDQFDEMDCVLSFVGHRANCKDDSQLGVLPLYVGDITDVTFIDKGDK